MPACEADFSYHSPVRLLISLFEPNEELPVPRLSTAAPVAAILLSGGLLMVLPVQAQTGGEKINQLIVYGDDPCPASAGDEITVCARKDEGERFRIPEALRGLNSTQNEAWDTRVKSYEVVSKSGTLSCSPVGPGGSTGCSQRLIDRAYAEKASDPALRFGDLIAEERARRTATIDADAAATQARVEQIERDYEARRKAETSGETP
jgi:hypothetical protein